MQVAPTACIRSRVRSCTEQFLFAVSKIDKKKFAWGYIIAQKHEIDVFITPKHQEMRVFSKIEKVIFLKFVILRCFRKKY
mgnify:CR=1 FL=1